MNKHPDAKASGSHSDEIASGERFTFGENWAHFLTQLNDSRIDAAQRSLAQMLGVTTLEGMTFLDIGSGSGLFSLAARKLGAQVHSFDFDPQSVGCTSELRRRYFPADSNWVVEQGSALDASFVRELGKFDVVYSWGVLHHTGDMLAGFSNAITAVAANGRLFIAIYNDQGFISRYWSVVKKAYNKNVALRWLMIALHAPYLIGLRWLVRAMTGRLSVERGMSLWYDMFDWLGGYPFEVAKPERVFEFFRDRGYTLEMLRTCGNRMGCNEFVFRAPGEPLPAGS